MAVSVLLHMRNTTIMEILIILTEGRIVRLSGILIDRLGFTMFLKDSGREFATGAVRDISEGKVGAI